MADRTIILVRDIIRDIKFKRIALENFELEHLTATVTGVHGKAGAPLINKRRSKVLNLKITKMSLYINK